MARVVRLLQWPEPVPYAHALDLQERLHQLLLQRPAPDTLGFLLALQHAPVVSLGRRAHATPLPPGLPVPTVRANRGGLATYHGPGQLTFYPVLDLRRLQGPALSLAHYVQGLTDVLAAAALHAADIHAHTPPGPEHAGLWLSATEKAGFVGVQARHWVTSHGFSLNVTPEALRGFQHIQPCGLPAHIRIGCLQEHAPTATLRAVQDAVLAAFERAFRVTLHTASPPPP